MVFLHLTNEDMRMNLVNLTTACVLLDAFVFVGPSRLGRTILGSFSFLLTCVLFFLVFPWVVCFFCCCCQSFSFHRFHLFIGTPNWTSAVHTRSKDRPTDRHKHTHYKRSTNVRIDRRSIRKGHTLRKRASSSTVRHALAHLGYVLRCNDEGQDDEEIERG